MKSVLRFDLNLFHFTGVGILISSSVDELLEFVDSQSQVHVIQKYIEQPLLLPGERKFDIRYTLTGFTIFRICFDINDFNIGCKGVFLM